MSNNFFRVPRSRRAALAGGAALVISAAAVHAVSAQQPPPELQDVTFLAGAPVGGLGQHRDDWLKSVAGKLGVSTDKLQQAIADANTEVGPMPPMLIAGGKAGAFSVAVQSPFASAAKALNLSEADLKKEMSAGKSLGDIAKAHNVDPKVVADAMRAQRKADIDKAVADGVMPQATADKLKATIDDEIDHIIQAVPSVAKDGRGVSLHIEWTPDSP